MVLDMVTLSFWEIFKFSLKIMDIGIYSLRISEYIPIYVNMYMNIHINVCDFYMWIFYGWGSVMLGLCLSVGLSIGFYKNDYMNIHGYICEIMCEYM